MKNTFRTCVVAFLFGVGVATLGLTKASAQTPVNVDITVERPLIDVLTTWGNCWGADPYPEVPEETTLSLRAGGAASEPIYGLFLCNGVSILQTTFVIAQGPLVQRGAYLYPQTLTFETALTASLPDDGSGNPTYYELLRKTIEVSEPETDGRVVLELVESEMTQPPGVQVDDVYQPIRWVMF